VKKQGTWLVLEGLLFSTIYENFKKKGFYDAY
jgi:hypothetical protein